MGVPELQLLPQHGTCMLGTWIFDHITSLLLHSHFTNIVRILSVLCQVIQDFSGRSFHYMGIRREEGLVGGIVTRNNFKRTAALNGELNERSLTALMFWGWLAVFAASLSFASRRKISKCYTENRSGNKLPWLKAYRDSNSWGTGIRKRKIHFNQTTAKKYNLSSFANRMKTIQKWHKNIYKFEKYLKEKSTDLTISKQMTYG